jgi:serine/threonine protein kinase
MLKLKLRIEEYELGVCLGQGSVGEIFSATEKISEKQVAIKILLLAVSQDPIIRSRFEREIVILERLRHRNIVEVYGGGITSGRVFYVMEYVDAGSVKELLVKYGKLPWTEVASIARQVCSALQYAHNHGIVHRDLKPANLFLMRDGSVKLGDFGIARDMRASDLTQQGLTVGTHAYMSPEQINADSQIDGKADLYSLGCVLFELLVGHPPFQAANFAQLFEQQLRKPAPRVKSFVPEVPQAMDDIIDQLLAKAPEDRPFNARAVQGTMISILDEAQAAASLALADSQIADGKVKVDASIAAAETCRIDVGGDVGAHEATDVGQKQLSRRLAKNLEQKRSTAMVIMIIAAILGLIIWSMAVGPART